jgi:histidine ammonia-lyase
LRDRGVAGAGPDRWLSPELASAADLVGGGGLLAAVQDAIGELA